MPRLFHQQPRYGSQKSTKQAVVSSLGSKVYLGPYGSQQSHQKYQVVLHQWEVMRHEQRRNPLRHWEEDQPQYVIDSITVESLRDRRRLRVPITISKLILVYRRHTREYYDKNGDVTREAAHIDDALRVLRKRFGLI